MIQEIWSFIRSAELTNIAGILLYWVPLAFCLVAYTFRTFRNVQKDKEERAEVLAGKQSFYHPTDTIGTLVGRVVASVVPVVNIWCALFDLAPDVFGRFFKWCGKVLDVPLVPRIKFQK